MAVAEAERTLTKRQTDCLVLVASDHRPAAIAQRLHFSEIGIRKELDVVRDFYDVSTLSGAVAKALWNGDLVFLETGAVVSKQAASPATL